MPSSSNRATHSWTVRRSTSAKYAASFVGYSASIPRHRHHPVADPGVLLCTHGLRQLPDLLVSLVHGWLVDLVIKKLFCLTALQEAKLFVSVTLVIEADIASDGEIVIALPRHLIDAKNADGTDDTYIVLVDGEEAWVTETADSAARTLTIQVIAGDREIEIFGTFIVPEFGTIAILILAAAVVSIIVVSGRARLSVMSKH